MCTLKDSFSLRVQEISMSRNGKVGDSMMVKVLSLLHIFRKKLETKPDNEDLLLAS